MAVSPVSSSLAFRLRCLGGYRNGCRRLFIPASESTKEKGEGVFYLLFCSFRPSSFQRLSVAEAILITIDESSNEESIIVIGLVQLLHPEIKSFIFCGPS
jgi:hypothetical protein